MLKSPPRCACEVPGCKRDAKFRASKAGAYGTKVLCANHAAAEFGKGEVELEGLAPGKPG